MNAITMAKASARKEEEERKEAGLRAPHRQAKQRGRAPGLGHLPGDVSLAAGAGGRAARAAQKQGNWLAARGKTQQREGLGSKSSSANQAAQAATKGAGYESRRCFALLLFCFCSRSLPVIAAALACECPQTRRKQLRETGLGIGYGESSTGHKQRRADAKAMEEQIDEQVDHDAVKHLELLEYMLSKYKTDHPTVLPRQQTNLAHCKNRTPRSRVAESTACSSARTCARAADGLCECRRRGNATRRRSCLGR